MAGGKVGLVPGLGTGALLCTLLQWGVNELHVFRIRHVYRTTTTSLPAVGDESDTMKGHDANDRLVPPSVQMVSYQHQDAESWGNRILRRIEELERDLREKPR